MKTSFHRRRTQALRLFAGVVLAFFLFALLLKISGCFLIAEKSMPRGLYRATTEPTPFVVIHLPRQWAEFALRRNYVERSWDRERENRTTKYCIAREGDRIAISETGITVNGKEVAYSAPMDSDSAGRPMPSPPEIRTTLGEGEFLVLSHKAENGFDSRYYGILTEENLVSYARPLLTE